ncbi:hypothetical protein GCM10027089_13750 [Nocardia thraciensis]
MLPQLHPVLANHEAPPPDHSWTVEESHAVMQVHRDCPLTICPAKRYAKKRLIDAKRLVPADVPHFGFGQ